VLYLGEECSRVADICELLFYDREHADCACIAYSGVLNHLTEAQAEKLVAFKEKLEKDGWWTPDGINGKPSHDDGTLL
jgi:hypothetical protein